MKIGIVGLPNVGKSTLFKALTKKQVDIANYPFCTIEPNTGIVKVPDERLDALVMLSKSAKIISAVIEFVDIAGLVKGASKGEGLGNTFLSHIREVDAIAHVVRAFHNPNVAHVGGKPRPIDDSEIINLELVLADLAIIEKRESSLRSKMKSGNDKDAERALCVVLDLKKTLEEGKLASSAMLDDEEKKLVRDCNLLTLKPMLYVFNTDESDAVDEETKQSLRRLCDAHTTVELCAKLEMEIAELTVEEVAELGLKASGLDSFIVRAYELLSLITYFTTGPDETRAWTIMRGTRAPQAAGAIHSDFEKGFIRAEVIQWRSLIDAGSELAAKEKGLIRLEGKDYIVADGDVCVFRFAN